ncbi:DUF2059 domain-containing protein [Zoogloea sp.]|uniref:DUF2059 domain-containing protein n=1 Tax=Zoogloea sp. TaxID=49181 RepID=UPI00262F0D2C|nr:DUF2059 domain-containing protein [Zoogloea sp.]MDD3352230.1 DUF2059 domain-containing protein [Zoogloea sp.]
MKSLSLLLTTLLLSTPLMASPPSPESVHQLLTLSGVERAPANAQQGLETVLRNSLNQALQGKTLTPKGQQIIDKFNADSLKTIRSEISWAKLKDGYVKAYTETFTQEEVNGLIGFYKSPTGQALLTKMPQIAQKTNQLNQQRLGPMVEQLKNGLQKAIQDAQAAK